MIANLLLAFFIIYFAYYMINCYCYFHPRGRKISDYEQENPFLSVLIPARNEEKNIRNAVDSVLKNNYPHLELIVLDDHSTDRTGEILASYSDSRLSVIKGKPLPKGWIGKNWACHQLSQKAKGDIIVFSDADTLHSSNGLTLLVEKMKLTNADLLSGIP
ncbi:MAG: glycosyltransferase, partial [Candidatus Moranbacteria bacterium]|nr:glycosyltransferase [Candidatus Moranbacteria bacterium]